MCCTFLINKIFNSIQKSSSIRHIKRKYTNKIFIWFYGKTTKSVTAYKTFAIRIIIMKIYKFSIRQIFSVYFKNIVK